MAPGPSIARWWLWLVVLAVAVLHSSSGSALQSSSVRALLEDIVSGALRDHCPSAEQETSREQRIIEATKKTLKDLFAETFSENCRGTAADPQWRCSCPDGFIPCGGRCYSRLHRPVEYEQAERQCSLLNAHLAVPRSRQQSLCVAGLAGYEHIWLGITDREEEGTFVGADGRPVTGNEGQIWSPGQPDNAGGREHCVSAWKVRGGSSPVRFGEWNDYPCTGLALYPMCQLP